MFVVVKIGGCNGSGKTSLVRSMLVHSSPMGGARRPEAYWFKEAGRPPMYALGSYETTCGGMDTISDKDVRFALVEKYVAKKGIVFFEGLITGKTYGALGALSETPRHKGKWIYAFMDTPFDVCVERVMQRRHAKGNEAAFDPERTMRPTYRSCEATARRAAAEGHMVVMVNHKLKPETAARQLMTKATELYWAGTPPTKSL